MLEVTGVTAGYDEQDVLHDISFGLPTGECLAIIGPNGCGKTTLLRTIASLMPFRGSVTVDGCSVRDIPRKQLAQRIALFSQISTVYFDYSVYDTVMMGRYCKGRRRLLADYDSTDAEAVKKALHTVGLAEQQGQSITALSGGQLQRVLLARALVQEPDIILLDEPTNHLDLYYQVELVDFMKRWAQDNNKSVIGVFHDINLAVRLADRLLLLHNGRTAALGTPAQVLQNEVLEPVYRVNVGEYMRETLRIWEDMP